MPNGAKPFGIFASLNGSETGLNALSKTSTRALWKSVAYRRPPAIVSPL